jgi:hypothetical protein
MELYITVRNRLQWSAFNGGGIGVWGIWRGVFCSGREVWRVSLGGYTKSAPISFMVDGRQVIAVAAGHALFVFELSTLLFIGPGTPLLLCVSGAIGNRPFIFYLRDSQLLTE